jgi:hypothetical protein
MHNLLDFVLQLSVVLLDLLKTSLLIAFEVFVDAKNALDFLFLGSDDCLENAEVIIMIGIEVGFAFSVSLTFLSELFFVGVSQFFNSLPVSVVIFLELVSQSTVLVDKSSDLRFAFLASPLQFVVAFFYLVFLLFDLIVQTLDLSLMQIFKFVLIFAVLAEEVVLEVVVLCFDEIDLVGLLFFKFLEFVLAVVGLRFMMRTSDLSS